MSKRRKAPVDYCGCCGNENNSSDVSFCTRCLGHVLPYGAGPDHERTWFAQHGTECPYEDGSRDA